MHITINMFCSILLLSLNVTVLFNSGSCVVFIAMYVQLLLLEYLYLSNTILPGGCRTELGRYIFDPESVSKNIPPYALPLAAIAAAPLCKNMFVCMYAHLFDL